MKTGKKKKGKKRKGKRNSPSLSNSINVCPPTPQRDAPPPATVGGGEEGRRKKKKSMQRPFLQEPSRGCHNQAEGGERERRQKSSPPCQIRKKERTQYRYNLKKILLLQDREGGKGGPWHADTVLSLPGKTGFYMSCLPDSERKEEGGSRSP